MLPSDQRLRDNRDFRAVYADGRSHAHGLAVLHVLRRGNMAGATPAGRRIGFVVSKKQGNAVTRNRIKRRLREAVHQRMDDLREGPFDLIFIGRSRLKTAAWQEIQTAVEELLRRAHLLRMPETDGNRAGPDTI